jgi:hypothetical protein
LNCHGVTRIEKSSAILVEELLVAPETDRIRKPVRILPLVQLFLDRLAEIQQVDPLEQEQRLLDLAELL